ncbi:MAG: FAD-binding oxidoreductase [Opitutales bacterium]|nr:FAD-binding oxidoreductase [Opitutales bacterium]
MENSVTIVGFGLAGAFAAGELLRRGCRLRIVDEVRPGAASPVGPGQINPLATRRFRVGWKLDEALPAARETFSAIEEGCDEPLYHERPILRVVKDEGQAEDLEKRRADPETARWIREPSPAELACITNRLRAPLGAFITVGGGWLDVPRYLETARRRLQTDPRIAWNPPEAASLHDPAAAPAESGTTVWCEGWRARHNPLWRNIDHNPAKGEWMRVRLGEPLGADVIVNGSCWIQPLPDGTARAGATYAWSSFEAGPSADARITLIKNLAATYNGPFEILSQHVGVRPIVRDTRPVVGRHPEHPNHWILNGLGSKGALYGPWTARLLAAAMADGAPLPREADVARFFR